MLPSLSRPPLECCLGTNPIQAEKLRPDRKLLGSPTLATSAAQDLYNLGSGVGTSLRELVRCIAQATGVEPEVHHAPTPSTFVDHVTLDTSRFTAELGPREMTPLTEGIRRTWDEIREVG